MLTPGVANAPRTTATARSQLATSWQPAAVAAPSTAAITGCGRRDDLPASWREHVAIRCCEVGAAPIGVGAAGGQFLEVVAGARRPGRARPGSRRAPTGRRRCGRARAAAPRSCASDRALRASGRLSVRIAMPPWSDRSRTGAGSGRAGVGMASPILRTPVLGRDFISLPRGSLPSRLIESVERGDISPIGPLGEVLGCLQGRELLGHRGHDELVHSCPSSRATFSAALLSEAEGARRSCCSCPSHSPQHIARPDDRDVELLGHANKVSDIERDDRFGSSVHRRFEHHVVGWIAQLRSPDNRSRQPQRTVRARRARLRSRSSSPRLPPHGLGASRLLHARRTRPRSRAG